MDTKHIPLVIVLSLVVLLGMGCQPGDPASGTLLTQGDLQRLAQDSLIPQVDQPLASDISSGQAVDRLHLVVCWNRRKLLSSS
jgi:hypothetical protein